MAGACFSLCKATYVSVHCSIKPWWFHRVHCVRYTRNKSTSQRPTAVLWHNRYLLREANSLYHTVYATCSDESRGVNPIDMTAVPRRPRGRLTAVVVSHDQEASTPLSANSLVSCETVSNLLRVFRIMLLVPACCVHVGTNCPHPPATFLRRSPQHMTNKLSWTINLSHGQRTCSMFLR